MCFCHRVLCCATCPQPWPQAALTTLSLNLQKEDRDEEAIKEILEDLDTNGDKQLSFEEFSMLVAKLTEAAHEEMHKNNPKGDKHSHGSGFGKSQGSCQSQGGHSH